MTLPDVRLFGVSEPEELRQLLDLWFGFSILDRNLVAQPANPSEKDAYLLTGSPAGVEWQHHANEFAVFFGNKWRFFPPVEGMVVWVKDENLVLAYDGAAWVTHGRQAAAVTDLTEGPGTADGTVDDVGASFNQTTLNNNFKELSTKLNALMASMRTANSLAT